MLKQQERPQPARHHDGVTLDQPDRMMPRAAHSRMIPVLLVLSMLASVIGGFPAMATAQTDDGTGAAIPGPPSDCVIPRSSIDLTVTPTPAQTPSPTPSPTATPKIIAVASPGSDGATPVASPVTDAATPVVIVKEPAPVATPTVDPLTKELLAASTSIASCLSTRDVQTFTAITSDTYRGEQFGSDEPISADVYAELAPTLLQLDYKIVELRDITIVDDSTVTALVTYTVAYQQRTSTWTFKQTNVEGLLAWLLVDEDAAPARTPDGAASIDVAIKGNAYTASAKNVTGPDVVLNLSNTDAVDHEALVLKFPIGKDTSVLLQNPGPALPDGVSFIGQATVPAGSDGVLLLTNLPAGIYTIVCLLPDENGLPYLSSGMEITFSVA